MTTTIFAYTRVSTTDQNTDMQDQAILARYPAAILRTEKASGTTRNKRPVLDLMLEMIGSGDRLVVWKLDRLARNMKDLLDIVSILEGKGASLEILDQAIDTGTASGKAFLQMLGVFAEFETNLRKERQLAGVAKAKAAHVYKGKPADKERLARIKAMLEDGTGKTEIAKECGVSRSYVYKVQAQEGGK